MNQRILLLFSLVALASCSAANERSNRTRNTAPVVHNTVVDCLLYDGMTKESAQLMNVSTGAEVQVMDTVDAYFVKARVTQNGKVLNGYMYRTCFPQR